MTRHTARQTRFDQHFRPPSRRFDAGDNTVRVALVAIHCNPQPAAFLGSHPLQRLQVMLSAPGEEIEFDPSNRISRMAAGAPPQLLPQIPTADGGLAPRPRLVQGEILSDDDGRLYEKVGQRIRPLQRLFSGPRGEVLELPAESQTEQRLIEPIPQAPQPPDAEALKPEAPVKVRAEAPVERRPSPPRLSRRPPQRPGMALGAPPENRAPNVNTRRLKTAIPEQWIKPWEFQITREEALYDMRAAGSSRGGLFAFIRSLTNWFGNRSALREAWRKWQALLAGKSLEEQLWAVRPPRGMFAQPPVRDWARQTLERAGYDPRMTLAEWEIFWRRKGL
ncbi:MAG TPA: hypothetical protein VI479_06365 [Blastocatellia bacterium]